MRLFMHHTSSLIEMDSLNSIAQFFQEMRQKIQRNYSKQITLENQRT